MCGALSFMGGDREKATNLLVTQCGNTTSLQEIFIARPGFMEIDIA